MATADRPYHHGDLRRELLRVTVSVIGEAGPAGMTLREVARRAGVSHTAATYHFGDKAGLLTALAAEGFTLLGQALREALETQQSFLEMGVAYVRFAVTHRAHFEVMFRPELYRRDSAEVRAARAVTAALLYGSERVDSEKLATGVAAWAIVHGVATLWLGGNLPPQLGDDPEAIARLVAGHLRVTGR